MESSFFLSLSAATKFVLQTGFMFAMRHRKVTHSHLKVGGSETLRSSVLCEISYKKVKRNLQDSISAEPEGSAWVYSMRCFLGAVFAIAKAKVQSAYMYRPRLCSIFHANVHFMLQLQTSIDVMIFL